MRVLNLMKTSVGGDWGLNQMRELVKLGVDVHVALPTDGHFISQYEEAGIVVHEINFSLRHIFKTSRRLKEIVEDVKPDIIHSHFVITTLIMRIVLRKDRTPRIFQVPGPLHLENWFFRHLEIGLSQKNDYFCGSCNWTNERYAKSGIPPERILLTYYGGYQATSIYTDKKKLRYELGLKDSDIIVGMVAYVYAPKWYIGQKRGIKGHEDFIDAIAMLTDKYPNLYGVCVGGAWLGAEKYYNRVSAYAKEKCNNIRLCGTRYDVPEIYPEFYCAVHPSHSENLGGAVSSLYSEIPTIATNVGGFPDVIIDGVTGYLVPPKDPKAIADAIEKILCNYTKAKEMTIIGKKMLLEKLNVLTTSATMKENYKYILNKK